jgi:uncharacterized membrane protein
MKHYCIVAVTTLVIMSSLDFLWIGVAAREFYKARIDNLEFHLIPAILFYIIYAAGIVVFVNGGPGATLQKTLMYGALFGFCAYATYDLTNLATLRGWPVLLSVVDLVWGTFVTAVASTCGLWVARFFEQG